MPRNVARSCPIPPDPALPLYTHEIIGISSQEAALRRSARFATTMNADRKSRARFERGFSAPSAAARQRAFPPRAPVKEQVPSFQLIPNSSARSFASIQHSSAIVSCACALFGEIAGVGAQRKLRKHNSFRMIFLQDAPPATHLESNSCKMPGGVGGWGIK